MRDDALRRLPDALPHLEHFGGSVTWLQNPRALATMVAGLRHLTSLDISDLYPLYRKGRVQWTKAAPDLEVFLSHPTLSVLKYPVRWIMSYGVAARFMAKFGLPVMDAMDIRWVAAPALAPLP
ncbi:hypothetical protein M427DRAFT_30623 [Gonapodya prolifera JEL478]|uniref:Uncharacterized protein n=1 Tax=Gonapodya prolifera (strain JEL478) TaxID=1344416 RepID=A0A139AKV4_GONPJ|nr:hypothetical protein M427DRAFT_30623 [Gonapodya prolifera JEL478]|eukprot:KXS17154.1 hypothetical protein M427DRAFT_30623 [Gonapodya prolifera JEL478]